MGSVVNTEPDTVLPLERSSRSLKSPNTLDTFPHSAVRTPSREKPPESGSAKELTRRLLEVPISCPPPSLLTPRPPFNVSEDPERSPRTSEQCASHCSDTQNKQVVYMIGYHSWVIHPSSQLL